MNNARQTIALNGVGVVFMLTSDQSRAVGAKQCKS